ncbi:transporter [Escherichia coli]
MSLLFSTALIIVMFCCILELLMRFPGEPLAGRAVVNGASDKLSSALARFHP